MQRLKPTASQVQTWEASPTIFFRGVNLTHVTEPEIPLMETRSEHEGRSLAYPAATPIFEVAATYAGWAALDLPKSLIGNLAELVRGNYGKIYVFHAEVLEDLGDPVFQGEDEMGGFAVAIQEIIGYVEVKDGIIQYGEALTKTIEEEHGTVSYGDAPDEYPHSSRKYD